MAEPQPVKLRDLVHSLASIMVMTTRYLDQSAANLQRLYDSSVDSDLSGLTAPRFTIDEVTVDLSLLVDGVVSDPESPPESTPVEQLSNEEEFFRALKKLQDKHEIERINYEDELAAWQAKCQELSDRMGFAGRIEMIGLTDEYNALQQSKPKEPSRALEVKHADYVEFWGQFVDDYREAKEWYGNARKAYEQAAKAYEDVPTISPPRLGAGIQSIETLGRLVDRADVKADVRTSANRMLEDAATVWADIQHLLGMIANAKGAGILVRIDPSSIAEADDDAIQHLQFTFRAEGQETVDVAGKTVEIPR